MQFAALAAALALVCAPSVLSQTTVSVSYDEAYDNSAASLDTVSCSDGVYGLESYGYTTFGSLPDFPYIGGAVAVSGWGSAECGTCWNLTYGEYTISVLAIDHASPGFNIALEAMNVLTNNQATFLGRVNATATQVDASVCGLSA
ncbi:Cerato-platanin [Wolfiporia cocos MD-104 SS10]|uniref:Cerato-platanin n=1 Tax=Wolfiporia cocos (strain MD-104) TaxID=742152 RepID=A0A2H3J8N5_WOLCO|nr:Cerato-platanin [Wolfiporia cocos MD-104 SS10]